MNERAVACSMTKPKDIQDSLIPFDTDLLFVTFYYSADMCGQLIQQQQASYSNTSPSL